MKRILTLTAMVLMIGLLAAFSYAQDGEDCTGDQTQDQIRLHDYEVINPDANGNSFRHGDEFAGVGESHAAGLEQDKLFIDEDGDGINDNQFFGNPEDNMYGGASDSANLAGVRNIYSYGIGVPQPGESPGPLDGDAAFGPGESSGVAEPAGSGDSVANQSRPGGK